MKRPVSGSRGDRRQGTGKSGEAAATAYLEEKGFVVVERNWRCKAGEIDIVARDGSTVVFVEVRTKTVRSHGSGLESVTHRKLQKLTRLSDYYLSLHGLENIPARIDIIGIDMERDRPVCIEHVRNATG